MILICLTKEIWRLTSWFVDYVYKFFSSMVLLELFLFLFNFFDMSRTNIDILPIKEHRALFQMKEEPTLL